MAKYCDNCDYWKPDGDGWGYCKYKGTTKGSDSCDQWR